MVQAIASTTEFGAQDAWRANRRLTLDQARQRSRAIQALRWIWAAMAGAAALSIFAAMAAHSLGGGYLFEEPIAASETLTMRAPRFTGRSTGGERFIVTAETASRQAPGSDLIDLAEPRMETASGRVVTADEGVYDVAARTIELSGAVNFYEPNGTRMATTRSLVDGKRDYARGDAPVVISGPLGEVRANAYEIDQEGRRLVLQGTVRGLIRSEADRAAPSP